MPHLVRLEIFDSEIEVAEDETILEIALEENIAYPFGCASGNCGACKSRLIRGTVHMRGHSAFALTEDEAARGLILACRAEPRGDCTVAVLNYDDAVAHPLKRLVGEVASVERLTHDIAAVRVQLPEPMAYTAGQFASVAFPGFPARDYSFAAPFDPSGMVEFHVRKLAAGGVSAFILDELAAGEAVAVQGPLGFAFLREAETGPIFAVAGGSGLAPVHAILQSALQAGAGDRPAHLWFGARAERDVYLEAALKALPGLGLKIALSEPDGATDRPVGFVTDILAADLQALGPAALDGARAYLAGPPPMVEAAVRIFQAAGLDPARIHADAFYTEAEKQALA